MQDVLTDAALPYLQLIVERLTPQAKDYAAATCAAWRDVVRDVRSRLLLDFEAMHSCNDSPALNIPWDDDFGDVNNNKQIGAMGENLWIASTFEPYLSILRSEPENGHVPFSRAPYAACPVGLSIESFVWDCHPSHRFLYLIGTELGSITMGGFSSAIYKLYNQVDTDGEYTAPWMTDAERPSADINFEPEDEGYHGFSPNQLALHSTDKISLLFVCGRDELVVLDGVHLDDLGSSASGMRLSKGHFDNPGGMALHVERASGEDGVSVDSMQLYVTDFSRDRIVIFTLSVASEDANTVRETAAARIIGRSGDAPGEFQGPCGVVVAEVRGTARLVVCEDRGCRVQVLTLAGDPLQLIRSGDMGFPSCLPVIQFDEPQDYPLGLGLVKERHFCGLSHACVSKAWRRVFILCFDTRSPEDGFGTSLGLQGMVSLVLPPE